MRALVVTPSSPATLAISEVAAPTVAPDQALVTVRAAAVNRGERTRLASAAEGTIFGWDVAGVIADPAALAPTFDRGARVVGMALAGGGWAEQVGLRECDLAEIPSRISFEAATTLPVAGLTAYRALKFHSNLLGAQVLITGASGAVGWFAVQLATLAGAEVSVLVRDESSASELQNLGAAHVIAGEAELAGPKRFDFVLDAVGGDVTSQVLRTMRSAAEVVVVGNLAASTGLLTPGAIVVAGVSVRGYRLAVDAITRPLGDDLAKLLAWAVSGLYQPLRRWRRSISHRSDSQWRRCKVQQ